MAVSTANTVVIFDGDMVLHEGSRRVLKPIYEVKKKELAEATGVDVSEIALEDISFDYNEVHSLIRKSAKSVMDLVTEICETYFTEEYLFAVKSSTNFRSEIFSDYKLSRQERSHDRYQWVLMLTEHMEQEFPEFMARADWMEADDLVRIWAEQCRAIGKPFVVCSGDKDLNCIEGRHHNPIKGTRYTISREEALALYYGQMLQGDLVDHIPGLPGIGPKTADMLIKSVPAGNEPAMQELVVSMYIDKYKNLWAEYLLSNAKLLHILRHPSDFFSFDEWPVAKDMR